MKLIGLHTGHNASACLFIDGKVISAIQEERLSRIKNHTGFPSLALTEILTQNNLTIDDIDKFIYTDIFHFNPSIYMNKQSNQHHFSKKPNIFSFSQIKSTAEKIKPIQNVNDKFRVIRRESEFEANRISKDKLFRVEHHSAHAASAYFGWGKFEEPILVLTCDGSGDRISATVNIGNEGKIKRIASVSEEFSIGLIYAMTTLLLGMKPNEHEYKLMGMAPYAHKDEAIKLSKKFSKYFSQTPNNPLVWQTTKELRNTYWSYSILREDMEFERFDAICAGLQLWTEEFLSTWVDQCIKETGIHKVALAGGTFMNVKANKCIMELDGLSDLFIFPSCGDETNPIGGCYSYYAENVGLVDLEPVGPVYWGFESFEEKIKAALYDNPTGLRIEQPENLEKRIAEILSQGEIVARFAGRDEFGARALGNRSILADPSNPNVIRIINDMIKNRDFWMPFACSILEENASDYIINPKNISAQYMILTFDTTDRRNEIVAGIHPYDGTARPQIVTKINNQKYHKIISEFKNITGIGAVLNTSFNLHGFPIVHSPNDALFVLKNSGLKYLALGPFFVSKL